MTDATGNDEETVFDSTPSMLRSHPIRFTLLVILPLALGGEIGWFSSFALYVITIPILILWWISNRGSRLTITTKRTTQRSGLIAKHTTEVWHRDIRNVQIHQSMIQRLLGAGEIAISSAGQGDVEIIFNGIKDPESVKRIVDQYR